MDNSHTFLDRDTAFDGDVSTGHLVLEGKITGDVRASEEIVLKQGAVVDGVITTKKYMVEEGAVHDGELHMDFGKPKGTGSDSKRPDIQVEDRNENKKVTHLQSIRQSNKHSQKTENDRNSVKKVAGGEPIEKRLW